MVESVACHSPHGIDFRSVGGPFTIMGRAIESADETEFGCAATMGSHNVGRVLMATTRVQRGVSGSALHLRQGRDYPLSENSGHLAGVTGQASTRLNDIPK